MPQLQLLPSTAYERVRPIVAPLDCHLAVNAVLEGAVPGHVYVDDAARPAAAVVAAGHRFYLAGSPSHEAFVEGAWRLFADTIYPQAQGAGRPPMFTLYYAPGWEEAAGRVLAGKHPIRDRRRYLACEAPRPGWRSLLPAGLNIRPVDRVLLAEEGLRNLDELKEEMQSERESVEAFLARSFGFCIQRQKEIISWCLSEYNSGGRCEVGIETVPEYRRRGLGTVVASALVEHALQSGLRQVGWHCWASNEASIATALKANFQPVAEFSVLYAWFNEVDNLAVNGNVRFWAGDYAGAVAWYERAFSSGEAQWWAYWNAACAYARAGAGDAALGAIRQAVARGFRDFDAIRNSEHLQSLRGSAGWQVLMAELA